MLERDANAELRIEKLKAAHLVDAFDCGNKSLNQFLQRHAFQSQRAGSSTTYLGLDSQTVIGFYSLVVGQIEYADAPDRLRKGQARHPIPAMILARLAISVDRRRAGLGSDLLQDAIHQTFKVAEIAGVRIIVVDAKSDVARAFYEQFDFKPLTEDANRLYLMLKDARG